VTFVVSGILWFVSPLPRCTCLLFILPAVVTCLTSCLVRISTRYLPTACHRDSPLLTLYITERLGFITRARRPYLSRMRRRARVATLRGTLRYAAAPPARLRGGMTCCVVLRSSLPSCSGTIPQRQRALASCGRGAYADFAYGSAGLWLAVGYRAPPA